MECTLNFAQCNKLSRDRLRVGRRTLPQPIRIRCELFQNRRILGKVIAQFREQFRFLHVAGDIGRNAGIHRGHHILKVRHQFLRPVNPRRRSRFDFGLSLRFRICRPLLAFLLKLVLYPVINHGIPVFLVGLERLTLRQLSIR